MTNYCQIRHVFRSWVSLLAAPLSGRENMAFENFPGLSSRETSANGTTNKITAVLTEQLIRGKPKGRRVSKGPWDLPILSY